MRIVCYNWSFQCGSLSSCARWSQEFKLPYSLCPPEGSIKPSEWWLYWYTNIHYKLIYTINSTRIYIINYTLICTILKTLSQRPYSITITGTNFLYFFVCLFVCFYWKHSNRRHSACVHNLFFIFYFFSIKILMWRKYPVCVCFT